MDRGGARRSGFPASEEADRLLSPGERAQAHAQQAQARALATSPNNIPSRLASFSRPIARHCLFNPPRSLILLPTLHALFIPPAPHPFRLRSNRSPSPPSLNALLHLPLLPRGSRTRLCHPVRTRCGRGRLDRYVSVPLARRGQTRFGVPDRTSSSKAESLPRLLWDGADWCAVGCAGKTL